MSNVLEKFQMQGQVAIVTGGAGLLGKQFARTLAQGGAAVVVADLNRMTANTIAETLVKDGYNALGVGVDVTDPASVAEMVETAVNVYGRLDVLVNSAGITINSDISPDGSKAFCSTTDLFVAINRFPDEGFIFE